MSVDDIGTPVPVEFSVQPSESGKFLYLRIGPPEKGDNALAMIYFMLKIDNKTGADLTLDKIDVTFPDSGVAPHTFDRNSKIPPGSREVWLTGEEEIKLTTVPPKIEISLSFKEIAEPVRRTMPLARHTKAYDLFCRTESDPRYGEYVLLPAQHFEGGGNQHFGYDVNAVGWTNGKLSTSRASTGSNSDRFAWERPVYSMADGVVLQAIDTHPDNPAPGKRGLVRKPGEFVGKTQITGVSVASIAPEDQEWSRFVVGTVTGTKTVQLLLFAQTQDGGELKQLCTAKGSGAERITVVGIDRNRVATLTQLGSKAELTLWSVAVDSTSMTAMNTVTMDGVTSGRLSVLGGGLLVTATRTGNGKVDLKLWRVDKTNLIATPVGHATTQSGTTYDLQAVDADHFVVACTTDGALRLQNWRLEGGGGSGGSGLPEETTIGMVLSGVGTGGAITEVALCTNSVADRVTTAVRTADNTLKVIVWKVPAEDTPTRLGEDTYDAAAGIDISRTHKAALGIGYRTDGKLRLRALDVNDDDKTKLVTLGDLDDLTLGAVDLISLTRVATGATTLVSACRLQSGVLKVSLWQFSGNNLIRILYGNEIVKFVHVRKGSIPDELVSDDPVPVKFGQRIALMGNAGSSGGPHMHIDAFRVRPELLGDVPELVKRLRAGETVGDFRPLQFKGVNAMHNSGVVPGGAAKNPLAPWDGHGAYFEQYVVLPPSS